MQLIKLIMSTLLCVSVIHAADERREDPSEIMRGIARSLGITQSMWAQAGRVANHRMSNCVDILPSPEELRQNPQVMLDILFGPVLDRLISHVSQHERVFHFRQQTLIFSIVLPNREDFYKNKIIDTLTEIGRILTKSTNSHEVRKLVVKYIVSNPRVLPDRDQQAVEPVMSDVQTIRRILSNPSIVSIVASALMYALECKRNRIFATQR